MSKTKAQDEQDSREKLEEDLFKIVRNILDDGALCEADPTGNYTRKPKWKPDEGIVNAWVKVLIPRLDRQAAITERECRKPSWDYCETCEALAELQERVDNLCASEEIGNKLIMAQLETEAEQGRTIVEYAERVDELEAENEKLKEELRLINTYSGVKGCECETTVFGMKLDEVRNLQVENVKLREKLSQALDHAHSISKLGELD